MSVADLGEGAWGREGPPFRWSKFFKFYAVFGKIWQNRMLAPPLETWRPHLGEILDPPLNVKPLLETGMITLRGNRSLRE